MKGRIVKGLSPVEFVPVPAAPGRGSTIGLPAWLVGSLFFVLLSVTAATAAEFHVTDAAGLQTALDTAAGNGEDDLLYLAAGTYGGNFSYDAGNADSLVVTGEPGTSPASVRLDGGSSGSVLSLGGASGDATVQILGVTIENGGAGGVQISIEAGGLGLTLTRVVIQNNDNNRHGGGVHLQADADAAVRLDIVDSVIRNNRSRQRGGGVRAHAIRGNSRIDLLMVNSLLYANEAGWSGGGLNLTASDVGDHNVNHALIVNSTITGNTADTNGSGYPGGGVHVFAYDSDGSSVSLDLYNTIVYHNDSVNGPGRDLYVDQDPEGTAGSAAVNARYSALEDVAGGPGLYMADSVIDDDPKFVSADAEDYRLAEGSPCIDAGTNGAPYLPAVDIEGNDRISRGTVDMGAFEAPPVVVYVAQDGFCGGRSPCYAAIGDALLWEDGNFVIKAAQGFYPEDVLLEEGGQVGLQAGWDEGFSTLSGSTRIRSAVIEAGLLRLEKGSLELGD